MKTLFGIMAVLLLVVQSFGLTVAQSKPGNIFLQGEPVEILLTGSESSIEWSVKNYFGKIVAQGNLPLNGKAMLRPPIIQPGYYELSLGQKKGDSVAELSSTTFAIITPVPLSPGSPFGTQTHFAQFNAVELMDVIARGNISHLRDELYWAEVEKSGKFVFPEKTTNYMSAAAARGITPLITLDWSHPTYDFSKGMFTAPHTDHGRQGYANYATEVVRRFGSQISAVEIWNEYNGGTFVHGPATADKASFYTQMLKKTYETTKPLFPKVKVIAGATVPISQGFFRGIFQQGAMPYLDILSVHPYRLAPQAVELEINDLRELTKTFNNGQPKPIWATEFSMNVTAATDREKAAPYLVQMAAMLRTAEVERMYYYLAQDDSSFPYRGLVRGPNDQSGKYTPNPAFAAYANLINQLSEWTPAGRISNGLKTTTYIYKFTKGEEVRHVLWAYSPATVELSTDATLTQTDLMGVTTTLPAVDGKVTVTLGDDPIYLTGKITEYGDKDNPVLADSLCDFDKIQGSHAWSYGYVASPKDVYQAADFKNMIWDIGNNDSYRWLKTGFDYPFMSVDTVHPGNGEWAVRRWQSPMTGKIRIEGHALVGTQSSDGVVLHVFLDDREIVSKKLIPDQPADFSIPNLEVEINAKLDFAISSLTTSNGDATRLHLRVFEVSTSNSPR